MLRRVVGLTAVSILFGATGLPAQDGSEDGRPELEVTALDYEFQAASTEIPAGWTTVELHNEGEETHVLELFRIPEEGTYREVRRYYGVLDTLISDLESGAIDSATYRKALKKHAPSFELERAGGPGMVAPGRTTHATSRLEPGTHVIICYVRDSVGTPHLFRGMRDRLEVEPSSAGGEPPEADLEVTLADYRMTVEGDLESGEQTVAVHYGEREKANEPPYMTLRLARLEEGMTSDTVREWDASAPAPATHLGGANPLPAGKTMYFTVNLEPGRYALVVPAGDGPRSAKTLTVP